VAAGGLSGRRILCRRACVAAQVTFQGEIFSDKTITQMTRLVRDKEIARVRSAQVRCARGSPQAPSVHTVACCGSPDASAPPALLHPCQADLRGKLGDMETRVREAREEADAVREQVRTGGRAQARQALVQANAGLCAEAMPA
jgi:hypothetical protein